MAQQDVYSSIKLLIYPARIFGLFDVRDIGIDKRRFRSYLPIQIWNILLMFGYLIFYITSFQFSPSESGRKITKKILFDFQTGITFISLIIARLFCFIKRRHLIGFFVNLYKMFPTTYLQYTFEYRKIILFHAVQLVVVTLVLFGSILLLVFDSSWSIFSEGVIGSITMTCMYGIALLVLLFCSLVSVITRIVTSLNEQLKEMAEELSEEDDLNETPLFVKEMAPAHPALRNRAKMIEKNVIMERLKVIGDLYSDVHRLSKIVNQAFSIQLVCYVVIIFPYITFATDQLLVQFLDINKDAEASVLINIVLGINLVFQIASLLFLTRHCSKAENESSQTTVLIHSVMNETTDDDISEELRVFSLSMFYQKIEFSAGGFLPLNNKLLYSIVGAVTTYLVIAIQFQMLGT